MTQAHDLLPDFDDMIDLANKIKAKMERRASLDAQIKVGMAQTYKMAMTDKRYFENGKPPSVAFVKSVYEYTGLNDELIPLREEYAQVCAELDNLQTQFDIMKTKIDIYRTESANKRASL